MNRGPDETLIPIDMAGRTRIQAWMVFDFQGRFTNVIKIRAGDREATWVMMLGNTPRHRRVRFMNGDRNLKPRNCDGAANYIYSYVKTHAANFEQMLRP